MYTNIYKRAKPVLELKVETTSSTFDTEDVLLPRFTDSLRVFLAFVFTFLSDILAKNYALNFNVQFSLNPKRIVIYSSDYFRKVLLENKLAILFINGSLFLITVEIKTFEHTVFRSQDLLKHQTCMSTTYILTQVMSITYIFSKVSPKL